MRLPRPRRPRSTVQLREHARLTPPHPGAELVTLAVTVSQELVTLWASPADHAALRASTGSPGQAVFPDSRTGGPAAATVVVHGPEPRILPLEEVGVAHPHIDLLPDGRILLVGSRAAWTAEGGAEHNAVVYDAAGRVERTGTFGDGIAHVQTTGAGDAWVGYFDEGVYGNDGWGCEDGPPPVGAAGVVRFDAELEKAWDLPHDDRVPPVDECSALNVGASAVWTCYDMDFPVVRIDGERVAVFAYEVESCGVLVADEEQVGLLGGDDQPPGSLTRCRLEAGRVVPEETVLLRLPDGGALGDAHVLARADQLHVVQDGLWLRADPLRRRS